LYDNAKGVSDNTPSLSPCAHSESEGIFKNIDLWRLILIMGKQKEYERKSDLSERDIEAQDDALKKWMKEKKKSEKKTTSLLSEIVGGVIEIIS